MKEIKFQEKREDFIEGIDDEFQDLASQLSNVDFSKQSNKNSVLNATLKNINNEDNNMKKIKKIKKTGIVAASLLIASTLVAQTTFAQDAVNKIIKSISLGHITIVQDEDNNSDDSEVQKTDVPDSLKGKAFDKNGKLIEVFTKDTIKDGMYDKDGKQITKFTMNDGSVIGIVKSKNSDDSRSENILYVADSSKLNEYTCFNVKLPTYLPDGYKFEKALFTKDQDGNVKDSKYAELYFKNQATGKEIYMQERFSCEETKSEMNADVIEKISINGVDAILSNGRNIDWEADSTIYCLHGHNITKDEAIKIAESIK